jgi:ABC-2 type transport system permease protein
VIDLGRVSALVAKELKDLSRNRAAILPVAVSTLVFLALPLALVIAIPLASGHPLGYDEDLAKASIAVGTHPELSENGRVELFLFQQFLMVFLLMPITGAMALAAHAVVGEKIARTLEPLLATPVTTAELLVAKVLGSLAPTLAIAGAGLVCYLVLIAIVGEPGVFAAMLSARTLVLTAAVGPAAALVALQSAILVSSRVNDPRAAQQFGVLIIIPLMALLIVQFTGTVWLTTIALTLLAFGLMVVWLVLTWVSVRMFERETILTRWK